MLPRKSTDVNKYLKYSGLAMQFFGVIGFGIFIGHKLDGYLEMNKPIFTVVFALVFFILVMVWLFQDLKRTENEE